MKKYRVNYVYIAPDGSAMPGQSTPWCYDRNEANKIWVEMKKQRCFADMRPETIDDEKVEKHIVTVAFKTYDYLFEGPVKKGQYVKVLSGGQYIKLKVLDVDPPKKENIDYVYAERV